MQNDFYASFIYNWCIQQSKHFLQAYSKHRAAAISFKFHKPDTYQVISAGKDKQFGTGGQFNQTDPEQSQFIPTSVLPAVTIDMLQANYDNITNVTNGRVVPK